MLWPVQYRPLPFCIGSSKTYFISVLSCTDKLSYLNVVTALFIELGPCEKFFHLTYHFTVDVINFCKTRDERSLSDIGQVLFMVNHHRYHSKLRTLLESI